MRVQPWLGRVLLNRSDEMWLSDECRLWTMRGVVVRVTAETWQHGQYRCSTVNSTGVEEHDSTASFIARLHSARRCETILNWLLGYL